MMTAPNDASTAALRRNRRRASLRAGYVRVLDQPRRQAQPVDGRNRDHDEEQRDFYEQQAAVIAAEQRVDAAGEVPGVDAAGHEDRGDADNAERGEAQRRRPRDGEAAASAPVSVSSTAERHERADPCRGGDKVQDVGGWDGRSPRCLDRRWHGRRRPKCRRARRPGIAVTACQPQRWRRLWPERK